MIIGAETQKQLEEIFNKELDREVKLILFSQAINCESCETTEILLKKLEQLSNGKINLEIHSPLINKDEAEKYEIERVPTIVIEGEKDYGIRYVGLPVGLEFSTLIYGIINISKGKPNLSEDTIEKLKNIDEDIEVMVFVTTTCGYCPQAAITAMNFAIASEHIKAQIIDASENYDLAEEYQVVGVPKIVINRGLVEFVGAQPEANFLGYIISAYNLLKQKAESKK